MMILDLKIEEIEHGLHGAAFGRNQNNYYHPKGCGKSVFGKLLMYAEKIFLFRCSEFDFFNFYKRGCSTGESNKLKSKIFHIIRCRI